MNKVIYPEDGLFIYCQGNCDNVTSYLKQSRLKCNFVIPDNFQYKQYLSNLINVINSYKTEMKEIEDIIRVINNRFDDLSYSMEKRVSDLEDIKIEYRDRMIK